MYTHIYRVFLSDIAVFTQIGLAAGVIYECLLELVTVFPPLEQITTLENLATDVEARGRVSEWSRRITRKRRAMLIGNREFTKGGLAKGSLAIRHAFDLHIKNGT